MYFNTLLTNINVFRVANVDYGSVEVVPSSNPDSQESFGDEVLAQLATKAEKKAEFDEEFKLMTKAEAAVKGDFSLLPLL